MSTRVRFGVLGLSRIAKKAVLPVLAESAFSKLALIGTRSPASARETASLYGCTTATYEEVLASDVDAVYISLPNSMHEEWSIKALEAGKHVWCEKPAALSYKSALVMAGYARKNGKRLMEGFMYRHHPQHAKVRELIQSGAIGTLEKIRARIAYPKPSSENIRMHAHLGGGFYYDALVYPLNAARMLAEAEPVSIECTMRLDPETGVDVEDEAGLFFENGLVAEISGGFSDDYRSTYEVIGTRGSLRMERAYAVPKDMPVRIFLENASGAQDFTIPAFDHFVPLARTFCESILSGSTSPDFEDELVRQARVTDAGWRSAQEHRAVTLTEVN